MIDMIFPFCGLSASGGGRDVITKAAEGVSPAFLGRLPERKHDDRARCLASADEFVRGCNLPKREGFHNVARYSPLCDGIEQRFCSLRFDM
jgi:hypothetical protein